MIYLFSFLIGGLICAIAQFLMDKFKEKNGSYICRELLEGVSLSGGYAPEKRTETYYKKRPCASLVGDACEILEDFLKEKNII